MSFDIEWDAAECAVIRLLAPGTELPGYNPDGLANLLWVNDILTMVLLDDCHDAILNHIRALASYPSEMDWGWYCDFVGELPFLDSADGIERLLELIGEHCRPESVVMVSLDTRADNHAVGFIDAEHWRQNADLVAAASPLLSVVGEGSLSRLGGDSEHGPRRLAELRHRAEERRRAMTEWERFAENVVALLEGSPVGTMAVIHCDRGGAQFVDEQGVLYVESLRNDETRYAPEINEVLASHGWTEHDEPWGPVWEFRLPSRHPRYTDTYREFAEQVVIGLRASKIESPTELTVYGYTYYSQADDADLSVLGIPVT